MPCLSTKPILTTPSILSPSITTSHTLHTVSFSPQPPHSPIASTYLIKPRHRLIRTPNLHLKERRLITIASLLRTLHLRLIRIIPRARPSKNIFPLLSHIVLALVEALLEEVLVGAGLALHAVVGFGGAVVVVGDEGAGYGEDVAAGGADWRG